MPDGCTPITAVKSSPPRPSPEAYGCTPITAVKSSPPRPSPEAYAVSGLVISDHERGWRLAQLSRPRLSSRWSVTARFHPSGLQLGLLSALQAASRPIDLARRPLH